MRWSLIVLGIMWAAGAQAATTSYSLTYAGVVRTYLVHVPECAGPRPLVWVFHGHGGSGGGIEKKSRISVTADKECLTVIYPSAYSGNWNMATDVGFVEEILGTLKDVDLSRMYAVGYSQGGGIAERIGCGGLNGNAIRAIAVVSQNPSVACGKPAIFFHGTADPVSTYKLLRWSTDNLSASGSAVLKLDNGKATQGVVYEAGNPPTVFYKLTGGGHPWPQSPPDRYTSKLGHTVVDISGRLPNAIIWEFFVSH